MPRAAAAMPAERDRRRHVLVRQQLRRHRPRPAGAKPEPNGDGLEPTWLRTYADDDDAGGGDDNDAGGDDDNR
eukprot:11164069-Lingulodinium_polyedra.AAC.1